MTKSRIVITIAACLVFALPVFGDVYTIDFFSPSSSIAGTITGSGPYTGTGISMATLVFAVNGGASTTYNVTGDCGGYGCLDFSTTGSGTITIVGNVTTLLPFASGGYTLLTGSVSNVTTNAGILTTSITLSGPDTKNADLLTALGVPSNAKFEYANTNVRFNTTGDTIRSADVSNTAVVPDGGLTVVLLGGVLMGIEALRRRVHGRL